MKNPSEHIVRDLSHTFEMTNDVILTIARRKNLYPSDSEASLSKRARKIFLALARNDIGKRETQKRLQYPPIFA